jgi:Bacterial Ig-like domain
MDRAYRFASKVPAFEISSSDPADTATGVAVNKTISITFSMPLLPSTISDANITISPSVTRTTSQGIVDHRIVTIDPTSNLANNTTYTVTVTNKSNR